jgi:hypothetical protein
MSESLLTFTDFGIDSYRLFLRAKAIPEFKMVLDEAGLSNGLRFPSRFAHMVGIQVEARELAPLPFPDFLFDDQKAIVRMALEAKRFADWKDCGLGKTLEELEFARQVVHITGKRFLIVTMNEIVAQIIDDARNFYGESYRLCHLKSKSDMRRFCANDAESRAEFDSEIGITNYEKFNPDGEDQVISEIGNLGGIALDESSRLKTGGGKQKWAIIKSSRGVPYKLSATGTPAPNDVMEFASQASFLERIRDEHDVIWTYFTKDEKTGEWTVKRHARPHFFRWMASWSIYVADPRRYGWRIGAEDVPQPEFIFDEVPPTEEQIRLQQAASASGAEGQSDLFGDKRLGMVTQTQLMEASRGFVYRHHKNGHRSSELVPSRKPAQVARRALEMFKEGRQTLIWCEFDAEVEIVCRTLREIGLNPVQLGGGTARSARLDILERFRKGQIPILAGKARMLGYGQNFQCCTAQIFSGFTDSFESFYQAVRRSYRYRQKERVKIFIPHVKLLEGPVLSNLMAKVARFAELIKEQEAAYLAARKELE